MIAGIPVIVMTAHRQMKKRNICDICFAACRVHSLKRERFKTLSDLHDIYDYIAFHLLASDVARNTTDRILEAV